MIRNPVPYTPAWDTPTSHTDLMEWIGQLPPSERTVAMAAAHMALNMAHYLVDQQAE